MKTTRNFVLGFVIALFCTLLLVLGAFRLGGIRHVYFKHVIATVEFAGFASPNEARALKRSLGKMPGLREIEFARASWSSEIWMARLQYKALGPEDGARRIRAWLATLPAVQNPRLVKATYYDCRLCRPERGDIVLGKPHSVAVPSLGD